MGVQLEIADGNPWYLSPDIWVVPGDDPAGSPGLPIAGEPAYVWARVRNQGTTPVTNATVRYYWSNPATVITQSTAIHIGTSFLSLAAGESKEVLCLSPWLPTWVNDGHECLIAEAFAPSDPLAPRGPNDPFRPQGDRHQAQRNLDVLLAMNSMAILTFGAFNGGPDPQDQVIVTARRAELGEVAGQTHLLGIGDLRPELDDLRFGLVSGPCGAPVGSVGETTLALDSRTGAHQPVRLVVHSDGRGDALILVEQISGERLIGGLGVIVRMIGDKHGEVDERA